MVTFQSLPFLLMQCQLANVHTITMVFHNCCCDRKLLLLTIDLAMPVDIVFIMGRGCEILLLGPG